MPTGRHGGGASTTVSSTPQISSRRQRDFRAVAFPFAGSQCLPVDLWSPRGGAKFSYAVCSRESGFC